MIITIHAENRDKAEQIEIVVDGADIVIRASNGRAMKSNPAGLSYYLKWLVAPSTHKPNECIYDTGFRCPFSNHVCLKGPQAQQAIIWNSTYEPHYEPVGQMTLFYPQQTHRMRWKNAHGVIRDARRRPYMHVVTSCKKMSVAIMEFHIRKLGWGGRWKITPAGNSKTDRQWQFDQMVKHEGRYGHCVFEEI